MSRKDELLTCLRERFKQSLGDAFEAKFEGRKIDTTYSLMHLRYVSTPADKKPFTPEQISFIAGFETAWLDVSQIANEELTNGS